MRKRTLSRPVEEALRPRLMGAKAAAVQTATPDLFPMELEVALDAAAERFRSSQHLGQPAVSLPARHARPRRSR